MALILFFPLIFTITDKPSDATSRSLMGLETNTMTFQDGNVGRFKPLNSESWQVRKIKVQAPRLTPYQASPTLTEALNSRFQQLLDIQHITPLITQEGLQGENVVVGIIDSGISTTARQKLEESSNVSFDRLVDVTTASPTIGTAEDEVGTGTQLASLISLIAPAVHFVIYKAVDVIFTNNNSSENVTVVEDEKFVLNALMDFQSYLDDSGQNHGNILIINRGLNSTSSTIRNLITTLINQKNTTVIIPAGDNPSFSDYQMHALSVLPQVIAVAAFANETTPLLGTGIGPRPNGLPGPDISAMGYQVPVMLPNGTYAMADGVHLPLGFVAASISLVMEKFPNESPMKIKASLLKGANLMPLMPVSIQGAGILDAQKILTFLQEKFLLVMQPRALLDDNRFFNLPTLKLNRTFPITLIYHDDDNHNSPNNVSLNDLKISSNTHPRSLIAIFSENNPINLKNGINILNFTVGTNSSHYMDRYTGNITITLKHGNQTLSDVMLVNITMRYSGGSLLLDETKSSSAEGPSLIKHGSMSIFYHAIEQSLGVAISSAVNPETNITPTLGDVAARGTTLNNALGTAFGNPLASPHDLLIISDFTTSITTEDHTLLKKWIENGRSALLMIPPSLSPTSVSALNNTLKSFGVSIASQQLSNPNQASTRIGNSITGSETYQFSYTGFTFSLDPESVRSRTVETILTASGFSVGVSYVEPQSGARMFILGTTDMLKNDFMIFNTETITRDDGIMSFMLKILDWLLEPNRIPVDLTMLSTTLYLNEKATISVRSASFFIQDTIKATMQSPNGTFYQIPLKFNLQTKSYQGEWTPTSTGKHVLWLDVTFPGKTPNNGRFTFTVNERFFGLNRELIAVVIIVSTLIIVGVAYWQVRKSRIEEEQLFEEQVKVLRKRTETQQTANRKQLLLSTDKITPLKTVSINQQRKIICPRCKTPAYNERARFCYKCGKEL